MNVFKEEQFQDIYVLSDGTKITNVNIDNIINGIFLLFKKEFPNETLSYSMMMFIIEQIEERLKYKPINL